MQYRKTLFVIGMLFFLSACDVPIIMPSSTPVNTPTNNIAATPSPTKAYRPTATPKPSNTPTFAPSVTLSPTTEKKYDEAMLVESVPDNLVTVFWAEDGSKLFYAIDTGDFEKPVFHWFAIDLTNGQENEISSAPMIRNAPSFGPAYHNFVGLVSPSGRYHLHSVEIPDAEIEKATESPFSHPRATYSLRLIDTLGEQPEYELIAGGNLVFYQIEWLPGEQEAILEIGEKYGYGSDLYLLEIKTGQLIPFGELISFDDPNKAEWSMSPNGEWFSVVDGQSTMRIISLRGQETISLSSGAFNPRWSKNSQEIIYGSGMQDTSLFRFIKKYDLSQNKEMVLLSAAELEESGIPAYTWFDISPHGNQLVFWTERKIWVVTLR